jgi:transposase
MTFRASTHIRRTRIRIARRWVRHFDVHMDELLHANSRHYPRQITVTAQRHGITRLQLNAWRSAGREGRLVHRSPTGFVPAIVVPEPAVASPPFADTVAMPPPVSDQGHIKVVSANGR